MDLQTFLYNHGIVEYVLNSAEELQMWFNSTPTVELSPYPRWQSLGLPYLPTVQELEQFFD